MWKSNGFILTTLAISLWFMLPFPVTGQPEGKDHSSQAPVFGEGKAGTWKDADRQAIEDLVNSFALMLKERTVVDTGGAVVKDHAHFISIAKTYLIHLRMLSESRMETEADGHYHVKRILLSDDVERIMTERVLKAKSYYTTGLKAERELRLGNALQYYYWSWLLIRTHPSSFAKQLNENEESSLLMQDITSGLTRLRDSVMLIVEHYTDSAGSGFVRCHAHYRNSLIESMDIIVFQENQWEKALSLSKGTADAGPLHLSPASPVLWKLHYDYSEQKSEDADIQMIYDNLSFPDLYQDLDMVKAQSVNPSLEASAEQEVTVPVGVIDTEKQIDAETVARNCLPEDPGKEELDKAYAQIASRIAELDSALRNHTLFASYHLFDPVGFYTLASLIRRGRPLLLENARDFSIVAREEGWIAGVIPIQIQYPGRDTMLRYPLEFSFNADMEIEHLCLGLDPAVEHSIHLSAGSEVSEGIVQDAIAFMKEYQMAVATADSLYFMTMFEPYIPFIRIGRAIGKPQASSLAKQQLSMHDFRQELFALFDSMVFHHLTIKQAWIRMMQDEESCLLLWEEEFCSPGVQGSTFRLFLLSFDHFHQPNLTLMAEEPEKVVTPAVFGLKSFNFR